VTYFLPTTPWSWCRLSPWWKWVPGTFPAGKGGRCVRLTTSSLSCAECNEIWELKPSGTVWATPGLLTFHLKMEDPSVHFCQISRRYISEVAEHSLFGAPVLQFLLCWWK